MGRSGGIDGTEASQTERCMFYSCIYRSQVDHAVEMNTWQTVVKENYHHKDLPQLLV